MIKYREGRSFHFSRRDGGSCAKNKLIKYREKVSSFEFLCLVTNIFSRPRRNDGKEFMIDRGDFSLDILLFSERAPNSA
jgi:hypothetical protein